MYISRVNIAVLIHNEKKITTVVELTYKLLGITLDEPFLKYLQKKDVIRMRSALHYQTTEKKRRKERESANYTPSSHKYKDGTKCGCVTGCVNFRCSCRKNVNKCTLLCNCFKLGNCTWNTQKDSVPAVNFFELNPPVAVDEPPKKVQKIN